MKMTVVAEGVEVVEQMEWLKERDCDEIQGYYFSRPVAPEDLAEKWF
jgi:EAL domain-containing protein (putative c-di-GMP-specific phosphodiesterase class I)